jgi:hypothetical protein
MDKEISSALGRLDRYLFRVKRAVRNGELAIALADTAELAYISRHLWTKLKDRINQPDPEKTAKAEENR